VVINAGGDRTSETDPPDPVLRSTESNLSSLPGRASDESTSSPGTGNLDLPPGAFGRRYRPLANGRLADATVKTSELSEEGKMSKLRRIKESAEEYEGFLMAEMIKTMRQTSFAKVPGGDTYSEIAEKPFTAAMTAAGGLGLAATIVGQVAAQEGLDDALAAHPEVMGRDWRRRLAPSMMPKAGFRPPIVDPPAVDSTIPTDGDDSPRTTSISTAAPTENFTAGDVDR
jgi:Rod binding domain-containing protein